MSALDLRDLQALTALVPDAVEEVTIATPAGPKVITLHPVGTRDYVRYVVKRFKSVRNLFTMTAKATAAMGADGDENAFMRGLDLPGQAEDAVDDRDDADTAFIALAYRRPASFAELQAVEAVIRALPDDAWDALYVGAVKVSYGENPAPFFGKCRERISALGLDLLAEPETGTTDSQTPTS